MKFVNRGDPATVDIVYTSLTRDNTWRVLDLSSIVPVGAKLLLLRIAFSGSDSIYPVGFRTYGNSNVANRASVLNQVAGKQAHADIWVYCSTDRKIEYMMHTTTTLCNITVAGWFL